VITEIENALTDRVSEILAPFGFAVEPFPDNPDSYKFMHPKGAVLVVNKGSRYSPPETMGKAIQDRKLVFELTVMARNLRKHQGVYAVTDDLALGLAGWKAPGSIFGAVLVSDGFVDRNASVWTWKLELEVRAYLVPKPKTDALGPNIAKITCNTEQETLEVTNGED